MKKIISLFFILNIICGFLSLINYEILYNFTSTSILVLLLFVIFYGLAIIIYIKNKSEISSIDLVVTSLYIIFIGIVLVFSILYQNKNGNTYNMMYFTKFLLIPHITYIIFNLIKTTHQSS